MARRRLTMTQKTSDHNNTHNPDINAALQNYLLAERTYENFGDEQSHHDLRSAQDALEDARASDG